ncbi:MAG: hypothetical protein RL329_3958 [Bacteroidota bacterium]|jgi:hypothetical protein
MIVCVLIASFVFQQKPSNSIFQNRNPTNILMRTDTVRTCFARFTDNGGINGNYSPNLNQTLVLCPPAAQHLDTNKISISFNLIDLAALCVNEPLNLLIR